MHQPAQSTHSPHRLVGHLGVWALVLAGCGANQPATHLASEPSLPAPPPEAVKLGASPFIVPGETLRLELSLRGIVGGETVMGYGQPGMIDGTPIIISKSRTETVGLVRAIKEVRDEVTTHIDLGTGSPVYHHADIKFGEREAQIKTRFGNGPFVIEYDRKGIGPREYRQKMPPGQSAYDAHSILSALRGWRATSGSKAYFYAISGRRLWHNVVTVRGVEQIQTKLGVFSALRIEGTAWRKTRSLAAVRGSRGKPRNYTIWVSEDGDRKPLLVTAKTEYGTVKAELVSYERPDFRLSVR